MKYLHNGIWFRFISRHNKHDLYGSGPLRITVDLNPKRVIGEFMVEKAPDIVGNKQQKGRLNVKQQTKGNGHIGEDVDNGRRRNT